ncbi:MAG: hypothetical protein QOJ29_4763 [Thermoleophilaceae bacterium]|nr:hypothetical protein [Thermoleophilaceae bacterium]
MFSGELLPIYLNDHLAGATAGRDLAHRAASSNEGTEFGPFLTDLAGQIDADRAQLEDVMARLEVATDQVKVGVFWLGEKLGRLKLNGRLLDYSPLSRMIELEGLTAGVRGKLALWRTLAAAAPAEPRIADIDFPQLIARAEEQLAGLDEHHARAVELMLAEDPVSR